MNQVPSRDMTSVREPKSVPSLEDFIIKIYFPPSVGVWERIPLCGWHRSYRFFPYSDSERVTRHRAVPMKIQDNVAIIYCIGMYGRNDAVKRKQGNKKKREIDLSVGFVASRRQQMSSNVQHGASQKGKGPFAIMLTYTMGYFTYAENADMLYMYDHVNGNGRAALGIYHM
ncbi:hypothetical protein TNCV_1637701 [Trichonephila clavipes]|nr:hypothetical protein TNCV_1637701 [Trichonephila clavipes]